MQQEPTEEHPYRQARDAAYIPPTTRNVGAIDKTPNKRAEPAYKTLPPIHDPNIAATVYKRSMDAPITITQQELLSLAPEIRSRVRESTTTRRIPKDNTEAHHYLQEEESDIDNQPYLPSVPHFTIQKAQDRTPPEGATVFPDHYEMYYRSLKPGEAPDPNKLFVSLETSSVQTISALVDNNQHRECILDPGCQVVAMSEATSYELGLAYDPTIKLNMQSANGIVDQTLGLARNVPFQVNSLTFYLQVHVIRSPAYDILLGRPFDVIGESVVRNFANEDQTITLHDPNTGRHVTVPTIPRINKKHHGQCPHSRERDF